MYNVEFIEKFTKSGGGILRPAIRMKQKPLKTIPTLISFLESVDNKLGVRFVGKLPRDNLSGKKVDDDAKSAILSQP